VAKTARRLSDRATSISSAVASASSRFTSRLKPVSTLNALISRHTKLTGA